MSENEAVTLVRQARMARVAERAGYRFDWDGWEQRASVLLLAQPSTPDDMEELRRRFGSPSGAATGETR